MKRNVARIGCVMVLMVFFFSQTAFAWHDSNTSTENTMMMENHIPNPPVITGPLSGKTKTVYTYDFLLTDPDGDSLSKILIEWGGTGYDNTTYICFTCGGAPKPNGSIYQASHSWSTDGNYTIRAKVWDTFNNESEWGYLEVTMPFAYNTPLPPIFERVFQRFPNAFPILRHLMGY